MTFSEDLMNVCFYKLGVFGAEDGNLPLEMCDLNTFEKEGFVNLHDGYKLPNEEQAEIIDNLMLKVSEWGFCWTALPNGDMGTEVTTETFGRDVLSKII
jgi:hypothetical protein